MIQETLNKDGILDTIKVAYIINNTDLSKFTDNDAYFAGNNPTIIKKTAPTDTGFPDNRVTVSYGRKLALTTKNYIFNKPVIYQADDNQYITQLNDVLYKNNNKYKIDELGTDLIVHGVAYKLFYFDGPKNIKYVIADGENVIPVYDYSIEPQLICVIRFYIESDITDSTKTKTIIECYYKNRLLKYEEQGNKISDGTNYLNIKSVSDYGMILKEDNIHGFDIIPCVVYGDKYQLGVFDSVKKLIDGVDTIVSSNLNEIQKFELAYLILKGFGIKEDDVDELKETRIISTPEKDNVVEYLTKTIDGQFNNSILDYLVSEIHKQSGVVDFASKEFAAESSLALQYKLMGFENLASSIEAIFLKGEMDSIDIINSVLFGISNFDRYEFYNKNMNKAVEIKMSRNIPKDLLGAVQVAEAMRRVGISLETSLDQIPAIENSKDEIDLINAEKEKNIELFSQNVMPDKVDDTEDQQADNVQ